MIDSTPVLLDPRPEQWLFPERLQRLQDDLGGSAPFLALSGQLPSALEYWLRKETALELMAEPGVWVDCEQELDALEATWREQIDPAERGLSDDQLRLKLAVTPGCQRWAQWQWGHRLEALFLERKQQLDQASCRLLRLSSKPMAMELYHQVRAGEASFEHVAAEHGEGPERLQGGLLKLQPLGRMPAGLGPLLEKLTPGELTMPLRLGEQVALVQLVEFRAACFDASTRTQLLQQELKQWLSQMLPVVQAHLISTDRLAT